MKRFLTLALALGLAAEAAHAGNDTKRGQAGATELLINPWARSSGWNGAGTAGIRGIEAMNFNVGGLAFVKNLDFTFASQRYLSGSGININTLGFATRLNPTGVLGITVSSMSLGDFIETTYNLPEGTGNTFAPQYFNFGLGYSKKFSERIYAGIVVRGIYEGIASASAFGMTFDAGVQYKAGTNDAFKFGVALRNVGPKMVYSGEGLSFRGTRDAIGLTLSSRVAPYEMPALLNIGTSYDFLFPAQELRLTPAFTFTSNTYTNDNITPGLELSLRETFMLRTSYNFRGSLTNTSDRTDAYTGFAAGATIDLPLAEMFGSKGAAEMTGTAADDGGEAAPAKEKRDIRFGIDYSFRSTNPYAGTHALGIVVKL